MLGGLEGQVTIDVQCTILGGEPLIRLARCRRPPTTANQTKETKETHTHSHTLAVDSISGNHLRGLVLR